MKPNLPLRPAPRLQILLSMLLLAALFAACKEGGSTAPNDPDPQDSCLADSTLCPDPEPVVRNCATDPVVFSEYLIDPSLLKAVGEIGGIAAKTEIGGRSYIFPKDGQAGQRLLLTAPADMKLIAARHYVPLGAAPGYTPDWSLALSPGCGILIELYHVKDLHDSIKARIDTTIYSSSAWSSLDTAITLKAGQTIGWYIPGLNSVAFDFVIHNDSVTNRFINQPRYVARSSNILHTVCPYDLFAPAKKAAYYALLGSGTGTAVPGASCGTVERDSLGTPAGQWFFESTFTTERPVLRKDGNYGEPLPLIIAADSTILVGHIGPNDDFRVPRANPTWKDLRAVTTEWCYQTYTVTPTTAPVIAPGWLYVKMISPMKMNVAYSETGTCPSTFPTSGFKAYYR